MLSDTAFTDLFRFLACLGRNPWSWCYFTQALVKAQLKMGSDRESRKRAWEENELSSLAKAIVKFPAGSQNRELACRSM